MTELPRKLATIMAVDIAGYSQAASADEAAAASAVAELRATLTSLTKVYGGRIFNAAGDGFMLELDSVTGALGLAQDLGRAAGPPRRTAIHVGEVLVTPEGDLLGHGVNVAARLQASAPAGGVIVSGDAHRIARGPVAARLTPQGIVKLDKMDERLEVFLLGASEVDPKARPAKRLGASEPLLAVLPFENLSGDSDWAYFTDGITEEILQAVARSVQLKVIGRNSSFQFRGPDKSATTVAAALGVTHILDGAVRRNGGRIRVSAQLVDAQSQTTLWTHRFDRTLTDIFTLQDEIAESVAEALGRTFDKPGAQPPVDPTALDLVMRGHAANNSTLDGYLRGAVLFDQAARLAPGLARAWGALATTKANLAWLEQDEAAAQVWRTEARAAAERAIALDPGEGRGYVALYRIATPFANHAATIADLEIASVRAPSDGNIVRWLAVALGNVGRLQESFTLIEKAYRMDPLFWSIAFEYGVSVGATEDHGRALELTRNAAVRWPDNPFIIQLLAVIHACHGDWREFDQLAAANGRTPPKIRPAADWAAWLALIRSPSTATRGAFLDSVRSSVEATGRADMTVVAFGARTGLDAELYDILDSPAFQPAMLGRAPPAAALSWRLLFASSLFGEKLEFRNDPRFVSLCAKLGLVDYWLKTKSWPDCVDAVPYDFRAECVRVGGDPGHAAGRRRRPAKTS